ncbi:uncharacterized protein DEA37_0012460 [Paragonimus westermani]|uniref:Calponin-homology (CH) domain-containing protein n=1 Tax=Paragonimus westermani TaxID=34504 RepID=A0A5J4NDW8_9TREM|nr:uncharacterized protein DEA37_0012460 [Paragonimus westermani]
MTDIDDAVLQNLYIWVDKVPLTRVKRNISRDFSDGVLMAEVMKHFFPKYVNLHNFPICNASDAKKKNWQLLNWKVFKKLNFELSDDVIDALVAGRPGTIEKVLLLLKTKIERMVADDKGHGYDCRPESDRFQTPITTSLHMQNPTTQPRVKKPTGPQRLANARPHHPVPTSQMDSFHAVPLQRTGVQHVYPGDGQLPSSIDTTGYVARTFYDEKVQDCLTLEETVEILNAKIRRLEHLINLKDHRIGELQQIIVGFRGQGVL